MDLAQYFKDIDISSALPITDPTWIFFIVLIIILFAPLLLTRLKIPHIIGMILAGIAVGEHGFNLLERDSSFELFGQVGIYYIMFLAGLEMNMSDFKANRTKAVVLGLLAFIIPISIGLVTNVFLLEYGLLTSILLASMYASHTLVAYPIVIRYGVSRSRSVSIAVGGTAVTDTLTLLVLAVISGLFKGEGGGLFWLWLIVRFVVLGALILYLFPRIGRWFFRRYDDRVMQFIFVLALVFLGAGLMELIGMEGILGAFLVGLVLNRLIPHVSPLMGHLEFVGNALFIPYFLIGVGMMIDLGVIFGEGDALKVAAVMIAVALVGKWIASWLTQKIYRMSRVERELMFGLSNAQAAATLAAVLVGYNIVLPSGERLLNEDVLNGTIILILVTCIVSSLVTERASAKMVQQEDDRAANDDAREVNRRILVPVANPDNVEQLITMAMMVKGKSRDDSIYSLYVSNDGVAGGRGRASNGRKLLERAAMVGAAVDEHVVMLNRYDINIASGIIHTMKENDISEVIIGLHRRTNVVDTFFGNVFASLINGTNRQLMIVKCIIPVNTLRRIVVAVPAKAEYESGFTRWVETLCSLGMQTGCRVHFHAPQVTLGRIKGYIDKRHKNLRTEYSELESWDDLLLLTGQVRDDHLMVIVSSRQGAISYDPRFEKLPTQLGKYFAYCSFAVIIPEQFGEHDVDKVTFTEPMAAAEMTSYANLWRRVYGWFRPK